MKKRILYVLCKDGTLFQKGMPASLPRRMQRDKEVEQMFVVDIRWMYVDDQEDRLQIICVPGPDSPDLVCEDFALLIERGKNCIREVGYHSSIHDCKLFLKHAKFVQLEEEIVGRDDLRTNAQMADEETNTSDPSKASEIPWASTVRMLWPHHRTILDWTPQGTIIVGPDNDVIILQTTPPTDEYPCGRLIRTPCTMEWLEGYVLRWHTSAAFWKRQGGVR